ncbi:MAG: preprotein translocase subunit SecG [Methyloligellaceae bacterium]
MDTVVLVIHLMIAAALVGLVLLQRSEGGALGIGGGGGGGAGGFMTGRGAANLLTRVTAVLAAAFFATSITLTILARQASQPTSILEGTNTEGQGGQTQGGGILPKLQPAAPPAPTEPQVPRSQ